MGSITSSIVLRGRALCDEFISSQAEAEDFSSAKMATNNESNTMTKVARKSARDDEWSTDDLALVAASGVTKVDNLRLQDHIYKEGSTYVTQNRTISYSIPDIERVAQILPVVTGRVFISLSALPGSMGVEHWEAMATNTTGLEQLVLDRGSLGGECEREVGRMVARAELAILQSVKFAKFSSFESGLVQGLGEEGATCTMIRFFSSTAEEYRDQVRALAHRLGWRVRWNTDSEITINK